MRSVLVRTLGCSKNSVDTEHLLACLPKDRFTILPEDWQGEVDDLLVNTCGFIGDAKEESIQAILSACAQKQEHRAGRVIVFGCLSQRYASELPSLIPEVDMWFGARDLTPLIEALGGDAGEKFITRRNRLGQRLPYAWLKISEGCDRRCSYCAIPFIRGAHRSVPMEKLVEEAENLASEGVRELILIAQDTTWYGLDLYGRRALGELLSRLSGIDGIEWIRIHYSYPADFPQDVLEQMATNPKVCRYLDIPLQHISDRVLSNMHRGIDSAGTRELIRRLREKVPGVALRTTLIVGHPGEGPQEFRELLDFVKEARFERMGAFIYSEEEGTFGAEHLQDDVPAEEKQRRLDELMALQMEISSEYNRSRVGQEITVLADSILPDGRLVCRSEFDSPEVDGEVIVSVPDPAQAASLEGKFITVLTDGATEYDLTAKFVR